MSRRFARRFLRSSPSEVFVPAVFLAGGIAVVASLLQVLQAPPSGWWLILAAFTLVAGAFPLKVPQVPATLSLSEVFVFTAVLWFGPAPATLIVAADGLVASLRRPNRSVRRVAFNVAEPAFSVWCATGLYTLAGGPQPLVTASAPIGVLLLPVIVLSVSYFLLNSGLTALAVTTETGRSPYAIWREHFAGLSLNYFAGASIALLLSVNAGDVSLSALVAVLPLLALLYVTFRGWVRGIEATCDHLRELNRVHVATVEALALAVDARDQVTHGHVRRVQAYALLLARRMGVTDPTELKAIEIASLLHDTGKIAVPDDILNKPGKLTVVEFERMKQHTVVGADILSAVDFPYPVVPIVRHHHENWDGSGYPDGLMGTDIPLGARILSVIDCYDALTSSRPYRGALSSRAAEAIIQHRRGWMYDPDVVDAFIDVLPELPVASSPSLAFLEAGTSGNAGSRHEPMHAPALQPHAIP